jgi:hypothetical protein
MYSNIMAVDVDIILSYGQAGSNNLLSWEDSLTEYKKGKPE